MAALKGEPLARSALRLLSKRTKRLSLRTHPNVSSVFDTVATALYQLGNSRGVGGCIMIRRAPHNALDSRNSSWQAAVLERWGQGFESSLCAGLMDG